MLDETSDLQNSIIVDSLPRWIGIFVGFIAMVVMLAWLFNITILTSIYTDFATMKFNTALLFLCSGAGLLLILQQKLYYAKSLAFLIFALAILTLLQYQFNWNFGIDELIVKDHLSSQNAGRMSVATAINFLLVAVSIFAFGRIPLLSRACAYIVGFNAFVAISTYMYNPDTLYQIFIFETMALHTAIGFLLIMFGLILANRTSHLVEILISNSIGSLLLKRLLPIAFLTSPILFGLVSLGENIGWYLGDFTPLLNNLLMTVVWLVIIRWIAGQVHEIDIQRVLAQTELERTNAELDQRVQQRTAELQASENRSEQAEIIGHFGHWERDYVSMQGYWSKGAFRIFGIPEEEAIHIDTFYDHVYIDDREDVQKYAQAAIQNRQTIEEEFRIVRPDGEIRTIHSTGELAEHEPGITTRYVGTMQDVTEQRKLLQDLRMSQAAVQASGELINVVDKDYCYVIVNDLYLEYHQIQRDELIGKPMTTVLGEELFNSNIKPRFDKCLEGKSQIFETITTYPILGKRNLLISYSPLTEEAGQINHIVIFIRDITELKQAEEQLRFTEARTSIILETAHDGIISIDHQHQIILFNQGAERIFGYSNEEVLGQSLNILIPERFHKSHGTFIDTFGQSTAKTRLMGFDRSEIRGLTKDGREFPAEASISFNQFGKNQVYTVVIRDMTEWVEQQEALEKREQQLREANVHLSAVNGELEAFSYSVSHDLRAPLRAIDGFSQALIEDYGDKFDDEGQELLQIVRTESQQMGRLIDDLIALSRYTRRELVPESIDLSEMVRNIAQTLKRREPERAVVFKIAEGLTNYGDPTLMQVVMQNLLANAWKYSSKRAQAQIEFGSIYQDEQLEYFVRDNGVGFNMNYVHKIFGAFQRLHGRNEFEGTGIGLATVQRIIHRHGGTIRAESVLNEGAVFYFTLGQIDNGYENNDEKNIAGRR